MLDQHLAHTRTIRGQLRLGDVAIAMLGEMGADEAAVMLAEAGRELPVPVVPRFGIADEMNDIRPLHIAEEPRRPAILPVPERAEFGPVAPKHGIIKVLVMADHPRGFAAP